MQTVAQRCFFALFAEALQLFFPYATIIFIKYPPLAFCVQRALKDQNNLSSVPGKS